MTADLPPQAHDTDPDLPSEHAARPQQAAGARIHDRARSSDGPASQQKDSLRGSRTSAAWIFAVVLLILLVLLAVFVLQNTQPVHVSFFGFDGTAPLAGVTLIAAAAGLVIAVIAGGMRILQLRRRVKRERKA